MKIVYAHNREFEQSVHPTEGDILVVSAKGGRTVAMEVIPSWLLDYLQQGDTIVRKVGIARCSLEDNFCKKTGRDIAQSRLKITTLKVVNIVKISTFTTVFFEDENKNLFEVKKSKDPYCAILARMLDD